MNRAALDFKKWCDHNKLTFNLNKRKVMVLSNNTQKKLKELRKLVKIEVDGHVMDVITEYRYLGVILNQNLNYNSHIKMIKNNVLQRTYLLKEICYIIGEREALTLYKSSILPFLVRVTSSSSLIQVAKKN